MNIKFVSRWVSCVTIQWLGWYHRDVGGRENGKIEHFPIYDEISVSRKFTKLPLKYYTFLEFVQNITLYLVNKWLVHFGSHTITSTIQFVEAFLLFLVVALGFVLFCFGRMFVWLLARNLHNTSILRGSVQTAIFSRSNVMFKSHPIAPAQLVQWKM